MRSNQLIYGASVRVNVHRVFTRNVPLETSKIMILRYHVYRIDGLFHADPSIAFAGRARCEQTRIVFYAFYRDRRTYAKQKKEKSNMVRNTGPGDIYIHIQ